METELNHELNPKGFIMLLQEFYNTMFLRKNVSCFTDYTAAKADVLIEMVGKYGWDEESAAAALKAVQIFEQATYFEDHWNEM